MAKEKKVSINNIDKIIKTESTENISEFTYDYGEDKVIINIKKTLNFDEITSFVNDVVGIVFVEGNYHPELKEMAVRSAVLAYYSNLKTDMNNNKLYDFVTNTDIFNFVWGHVNQEQISMLFESVDKKIDYIINKNVNSNEVMETLNDFIILACNKFANVDMNVLTDLSKMVKGISDEKVIKAILDKKEKNIEVTTNENVADKT